MKHSSIILLILLVSLVNVAAAQSGYVIEPHSPQTGPTDMSGADGTVTFFELPLWIQIVWLTSFFGGLLAAIFGAFKFSPFILGKVSAILQNKNRSAILKYIENNPGCTLASLVKDTGMNRGTARYHLKLLRIEQKVVEKKTEKMGYLFANGDISIERRHIYGYIRNPSKRKILNTILSTPGISNKELAEILHMSQSTVSWHLQPLLEEEMVVSRRDGRYLIYFILPELEVILKKDST
jgi:predicted transcriptional regulator